MDGHPEPPEWVHCERGRGFYCSYCGQLVFVVGTGVRDRKYIGDLEFDAAPPHQCLTVLVRNALEEGC